MRSLCLLTRDGCSVRHGFDGRRNPSSSLLPGRECGKSYGDGRELYNPRTIAGFPTVFKAMLYSSFSSTSPSKTPGCGRRESVFYNMRYILTLLSGLFVWCCDCLYHSHARVAFVIYVDTFSVF